LGILISVEGDDNPWQQRLGVWWIAQDHPDQVAIFDSPGGVRLTFGELAGRAHQLVRGLRHSGLQRGDVIVLVLPNGLDTVMWQLATQESGLRYITLNTALTGPELGDIIAHADARMVVVHRDHSEHLGAMVSTLPVDHRIVVGGPADGFVQQEAITEGQESTPPPDRSLGGVISYSSGTTGRPKAVHRRLPDVDPWDAADSLKRFGQAFRFRPLVGAHLVSAGMHHGGCQGFYQGALNVGQGLVIMERFDAERALALIEEHRVSTAYMVPTQFVRMLRLPPQIRDRYDHSSLETVVHSAAPCPFEIKQRMLEWWGPVIWETYGGIEGAATIAKPHRWLEKPGTVGRAIRGVTLRILDDDGTELPAGAVGHIYLDSKGSGFEYKGEPDLTRSVHRGSAFTIGDMGYLDDDGYLFVCDRAKDLIISGGVNIYPAEIEGVLTAHPHVADVAVIGVPDPEWGEQVKAVVELNGGVRPTPELAEELSAWCAARLASYKRPRSVDFREHLPRTDGGKLSKRTLRDEYWVETGRNL
jgi:long-chain acyl-CoA synthetase